MARTDVGRALLRAGDEVAAVGDCKAVVEAPGRAPPGSFCANLAHQAASAFLGDSSNHIATLPQNVLQGYGPPSQAE